jgi:Phage tail assembly chaperone protein, TAC
LGFLDLSPSVFWDMTPREFSLKLEGFMEREAYIAILHRRANNEKKVSMESLLGRSKASTKPGNVISIDEHKNFISELEQRFAK